MSEDQTMNEAGKVTGSKFDEAWENLTHVSAANVKRTYDEYQQESLETIRRSRDENGKVNANSRANTEQLQNVALQALQNAVTAAHQVTMDSVATGNIADKQSLQHRDIAVDRHWNLPEEIMTAAKAAGKQEQTFQDMVRSEVLKAVESMKAG